MLYSEKSHVWSWHNLFYGANIYKTFGISLVFCGNI